MLQPILKHAKVPKELESVLVCPEPDWERERGQDVQRRFQLAYLLSLDQSQVLEQEDWNWQAPDWRNLKVRKSKGGFTRLYFKTVIVGIFSDDLLRRVPFTHTADWLRGAISLGKNYQKRLEAEKK